MNVIFVKGNADRKKPCFFENRLKEIRRNFNVNNWHYIETEKNPADLITRMFDLQSGTIKKIFGGRF